MKLIDADKLKEIIEKDQIEMDIHKDGRSKAVHHGEYQHFLKRIAEQPPAKLSIHLSADDRLFVKNIELDH